MILAMSNFNIFKTIKLSGRVESMSSGHSVIGLMDHLVISQNNSDEIRIIMYLRKYYIS